MTSPALSVSSALRGKKAVIFDLFHTLTPLESSWSEQRPMSHQMLGVSHAAWNKQLLECSRERLAGQQTDAFAIIAGMARRIDPTITDATIRAATENRIARFADALTRITPETRSVIQTLRQGGMRIGLISNADVTEIAAWSRCPVADLFDSVVFSCHVGSVKPEPEIYRHCLRELAVDAGDTVFVGDGGSNELQGARDLGLTTIFIAGVMREIWPERIPERERQADFKIERLAELIF